MSLVGTRPILQDELQKYELHHRARIAIKPGITGMWQVSGRSDITDFEEVVRLDTEYISNWTFNNSKLFRPYIIRFITLILFTLPSAKPLLYEYVIPFFTAVKSFFMPFINV